MNKDTRKVVFTIDDLAWFKKFHNLTDEQLQDIFEDKESFKVIYTLYGSGKNVHRYTLTDYDGNKIHLKDLNGYQRGVVLSDCMAYFSGWKYYNNGTEPCGVIDIQEFHVYPSFHTHQPTEHPDNHLETNSDREECGFFDEYE